MRAFVDHVEAVVPPILLHRKIACVAVTTVHLDRQRIRLQAPLTGPALGDGRQDLQQQARIVGCRGFGRVLFVDQAGAIQLQRQRAFGVRFLGQQHALDIGVFDDARLGLGRVFASGAHGAALGPVLGVVQRGVVARHAQHGGGQAHTDAGLVHHVEHAGQAFARLADQIPHRTGLPVHGVLAFTEVEQGVGGAAPAALVVQTGQGHVVALPGQFAIGVDHFLGHDEQRNAAGTRHQLAVFVRNLGEHQVDDVFGELVLARRNPHLVALEAVARSQRVRLAASAIRHRTGGDIAQRRACLRFAQAHRARPPPGKFVEGEDRSLPLGAMLHEQVGVAHRQEPGTDAHRRHGEKAVGRRLHRVGQLHATDVVVLCGAQHAALGISLVRVVRGLRQDHLLAVEMRLLGVHQPVERRVFFTGNALAGVEHGVEGFARMVSETLALAEAFHSQPVVEQKIKGGAKAHGCIHCKKRCASGDAKTQASAGASACFQDAVELALPGHRHRPPPGGDAQRRGGGVVRPRSARRYNTSNTPAAPMPPPMHMVTQTRLAPRRLPSIKAWPVRRWPDTP